MKTLREWRLSRLLSIRGLEAASGVTTKTIMDVEHGRRQPQYGTMRKLCGALGVEPGDVTEFAEALEQLGKDAAKMNPRPRRGSVRLPVEGQNGLVGR